MEPNPYIAPSLEETDRNAYGLPTRLATDFLIHLALILVSWITVTVAYGNRMNWPIWGLIMGMAIAFPISMAATRRKLSSTVLWLMGAIGAVAPVLSAVLAPFFFEASEKIRDAYFLSIASTTLYVSWTGTVTGWQSGRKIKTFYWGFVSAATIGAIAGMVTLFMFLV